MAASRTDKANPDPTPRRRTRKAPEAQPPIPSEMVPVASLRPHPRNYRKHPPEQLEHIKASLRDNNVYRNVVVADDLTLLAGHGVWQAAVDLGIEALEVKRLPFGPNDPRALKVLAGDNEIARMAADDDAVLAGLLTEARDSTVDGLLGTGYTDDAYLALLDRVGAEPNGAGKDPDEVPGLPAEPVTKLGDLWLLGGHRLVCGDSTDPAVLERVLAGEHLSGAVITDPPYGVGIGAKNRAKGKFGLSGPLLTDLDGDQGIAEVEALWRASFGLLTEIMPPGTPYYINGPQGGDLGLLLLLLLRDAGLAPRHILIWVKHRASFSIGRLDYDYQHEPIIYGWKPGGAHPWYATEPQRSVLLVDRPAASPDHPTAKPVALLEPLIRNSTRRGETVLDPFAGSGSTLIAAEQTGRVARLVEIDPRYCDVICRRFQEQTDIKPVRGRDGQPVDFLASASAPAPVPVRKRRAERTQPEPVAG